MGMEDIEDVDALLAAESENGGLNKDLAAKLKAFEAMNGVDVMMTTEEENGLNEDLAAKLKAFEAMNGGFNMDIAVKMIIMAFEAMNDDDD
eukprot:gene17519-23837_t